jgi:hypothetical protein
VQTCVATHSEAHQLLDYVYGRPVGDVFQEFGGVMITLAALCLAQGLKIHQAGEIELARIWTKAEQIRAKQAAKPKHFPLPAAPAAQTLAATWRVNGEPDRHDDRYDCERAALTLDKLTDDEFADAAFMQL